MGSDWKLVILGVGIISGFMFLVSFLSLLLQSSLPPELCSCQPWSWLPYLVPLLASLGVFVGGVVFYLASMYWENLGKRESINKLLQCLPDDEQKIVKLLLKGEKLQSQLVRESGLNKVKVHRILKNLESKGVVKIESYGKTNKVRLELK